jgi:hypothetical protein
MKRVNSSSKAIYETNSEGMKSEHSARYTEFYATEGAKRLETLDESSLEKKFNGFLSCLQLSFAKFIQSNVKMNVGKT